MKIRSRLLFLIVTVFLGFVSLAGVAFLALFRIEVNGPIYRRISLNESLVADYVPPSQSLLQVALICERINQTSDPKEQQAYIEQFRAAHKSFEEEHQDYMQRVPEGELRAMMRGTAYETAQQYFQIAETDFFPLIAKGDHKGASDILASRMHPLFEKHMAAVDQIVRIAGETAANEEKRAASAVRFYIGAMIVVTFSVFGIGGTLAIAIVQGISKQTAELIWSERARREQAQSLQAVLSNMAEGVIVVDRDYKIRLCNAAAEKFLGFTPSVYQPEQWATIFGFYPPDGETPIPADQMPLVQALHGEPSDREILVKHYQRQEQVWLEIATRPIKNDSGEVLSGVTVFRDATQRKKDLRELRQREEQLIAALGELEKSRAELEERVKQRTAELSVAKEAAETADRLKSAFLATMSHELRTPLNSIIGFTGISLQELAGPLNPEQKKQLGMVQKSAQHLLDLINDVLDLSMIEAGQLEFRAEPFDVAQSVQYVVQSILPQAQRKGLRLTAEITPEVGKIVADRRRSEQVLINLLNNAIKFTERGDVLVRCTTQNGWLSVSVRDSGIGIDPKDLNMLFRPFLQLDSGLARKHEGTGLGLSICKKLIEMMGGTITVESQPGKGSTFTYRLPVGGSRRS